MRYPWKERRWNSVVNAAYEGKKADFIWKYASLKNITTVCEVGINAGHSAILWLEGNSDRSVILFDLPQPYSQPGYDYLKYVYGERIQLFLGRSDLSVPAFTKNATARCDMIAIDGSKKYKLRLLDFQNLKFMSHHQTILLLDDSNTTA